MTTRLVDATGDGDDVWLEAVNAAPNPTVNTQVTSFIKSANQSELERKTDVDWTHFMRPASAQGRLRVGKEKNQIRQTQFQRKIGTTSPAREKTPVATMP